MSKSQGEFPSPKKLCRALHSAATAVLLATLSHQIKIRECTFRMQNVYNTSVQMIVISDVRNSSTFLLFHVDSKHTVVLLLTVLPSNDFHYCTIPMTSHSINISTNSLSAV